MLSGKHWAVMETKAEKIEQLMSVYWEIEKSTELLTFAEEILAATERGESDIAIEHKLADYQVKMLGQPVNNDANRQIITWLKKVVSGDA